MEKDIYIGEAGRRLFLLIDMGFPWWSAEVETSREWRREWKRFTQDCERW